MNTTHSVQNPKDLLHILDVAFLKTFSPDKFKETVVEMNSQSQKVFYFSGVTNSNKMKTTNRKHQVYSRKSYPNRSWLVHPLWSPNILCFYPM